MTNSLIDPYRNLPPTPKHDATLHRTINARRARLKATIALEPNEWIAIPPTGFSGTEFPYPSQMFLYKYFGFDGSSGQPGGFRPLGFLSDLASKLVVDSRYFDEASEYADIVPFDPILFEGLQAARAVDTNKSKIFVDPSLFFNFDIEVISKFFPNSKLIFKYIFNECREKRASQYSISISGPNTSLRDRILSQADPDAIYVFSNPEHVRLILGIAGSESPLVPLTRLELAIVKQRFVVVGKLKHHERTVINEAGAVSAKDWGDILTRHTIFYVQDDCLRLETSLKLTKRTKKPMPPLLTHGLYIRSYKEIAAAQQTLKKFSRSVSQFLAECKKTKLVHGRTENEIAELLQSRFEKEKSFVGRSFPWVVALNEHAALPHYKPRPAEKKVAKPGDVLLIDVGCQYYDITTDITRTIYLSGDARPPKDLVGAYTAVLKAHIALSKALFFSETPASALDLLARQQLLLRGLNYQHGTGHGVGVYANVHEGPFRMNARTTLPIPQGVIITNEPGCYSAGNWGIRIENMMTPKAHAKNNQILEFETLTSIPYDDELIDKESLTNDEKEWLVQYYHNCSI